MRGLRYTIIIQLHLHLHLQSVFLTSRLSKTIKLEQIRFHLGAKY